MGSNESELILWKKCFENLITLQMTSNSLDSNQGPLSRSKMWNTVFLDKIFQTQIGFVYNLYQDIIASSPYTSLVLMAGQRALIQSEQHLKQIKDSICQFGLEGKKAEKSLRLSFKGVTETTNENVKQPYFI